MKAAFFKEHGGAEKIIYDDYRDPTPGPGEVVVRVRACALNQVDMLLLDGRFPPPEGLPHVNGCEVTGTLEAVGPGAEGLERGARVILFPGLSCGRCEYCLVGQRTVCVRYGYLGAHKDGGYAELIKAPAANVLPLPETIAFEAGAAVPLAMLTSWHALIAQAGCRPGQTVLVQAAGSGVGSAAIQIARLCGARVITTVGSDDKIDFARALGADHVVNYRTPGLRRGDEAVDGKARRRHRDRAHRRRHVRAERVCADAARHARHHRLPRHALGTARPAPRVLEEPEGPRYQPGVHSSS